ncbi:IclR family transcriptional regulator [Ornithinimicrobium panacihumi]|uniref:IclR family transcriptional regulator n=1 Tax=Ornithinimicrobium panacihumi TaxID=2008449 RepID=UPI003F8B7838
MRKEPPVEQASERRTGGVQSLERAFRILEVMADAGGIIGLSQLAERSELPLATIHRLVRSLVDLGYVRQEANRQYSLGPRLMRLAAESGKRIGVVAKPLLTEAVEELGESVNLAILDDDEIVYVSQVQPTGNFMRMFTEVGRRTLPHSTAVGKAILAGRPDEEVVALLGRTGMPRRTAYTLTTPEEFLDVLRVTRERGYGTDEGEQELGVRCVAVPVPHAPRPMAISMSGPTTRMDDETVEHAAEVLQGVARELAAELGAGDVLIG